MALQPCKECEKLLSSSLPMGQACPECGNPDPLNKRRDNNIGIVALVLVGLGIAWWKFPAFFDGVLHKLF